MANHWAEKGFAVVLISLDDPAHHPFFPLRADVTYEALDLLRHRESYLAKSTRTVNQISKVHKCIVAHEPDVLIAQLDITIFLAMSATMFTKTKVIVYEGNNPYLNTTNKYLQKINNFLYRFTDHLVLQTQQITQTFPSYLQKKISVIYNPIASPATRLDHEDYVENFYRKKIISIGRLEPQKGYDVLIKAFHLFLKDQPGWSLTILGEGKERPNLEHLCKTLKVADKVALPGNVKEPHKILQEASMFILSSRFEGLPNVLLEAMSIGLPVVATRCKFGPEEIIQDRVDGLLVPTEDPNALAAAMATLAIDSDLGEYLGTNAQKITDALSIDKIMQQWETVIHAL